MTIIEGLFYGVQREIASKLQKNWKNRFQMPKLEYRHYTMARGWKCHPLIVPPVYAVGSPRTHYKKIVLKEIKRR